MKSIAYTNKLSVALKALEIHITEEEEQSEDRAINARINSDNEVLRYPNTSMQATTTEGFRELLGALRGGE